MNDEAVYRAAPATPGLLTTNCCQLPEAVQEGPLVLRVLLSEIDEAENSKENIRN